jgi:hypothetical protein
MMKELLERISLTFDNVNKTLTMNNSDSNLEVFTSTYIKILHAKDIFSIIAAISGILMSSLSAIFFLQSPKFKNIAIYLIFLSIVGELKLIFEIPFSSLMEASIFESSCCYIMWLRQSFSEIYAWIIVALCVDLSINYRKVYLQKRLPVTENNNKVLRKWRILIVLSLVFIFLAKNSIELSKNINNNLFLPEVVYDLGI